MDKQRYCAECPLYDRPQMPQQCPDNPDILFVGGFPLDMDIRYGAFMGKNSALLRHVVERMRKTMNFNLIADYTYACQCQPEYDHKAKKFLVDAKVFARCTAILRNRIDRNRPKAIVALGADALKALGFKEKPADLRGGIFSFESNGVKIPVVATFHVVAVSKSPGYLPTLEKDIGKACVIARGGLPEMKMRISTPVEVDEIISELDRALACAAKSMAEKKSPLAISVDTETTSLKPWLKEERVIAVSMSWEDAQGLAYPYMHRSCPFSDSEMSRIRTKTEEVLSSPNVAVVMANAKFDTQWLRYHLGMNINDSRYDVLLAEHILDEDKKGEYSLKDITCDRLPAMGKYEAELKAHRDAVWKAKDDKIAELASVHEAERKQNMVNWWVNLGQEERKSICASWISAGYVSLADTSSLLVVKYRKFKGQNVIPKKYQEALYKMVGRVPAEELARHMEISDFVPPEELTRKTYEDVELGLLLRYAAIDALTTRMILRDQQRDLLRDGKVVESAEQVLGRKLPTRQCFEVMYDNTLPLCQQLAGMEYFGIRLDRERCQQYCDIVREKLDEAREIMFQEVGRQFNTSSSSPDLGQILFEEMRLPVKKQTDTGAPSTDADTIRELADEYKLPFLEKLLVYRKLDKCLGTYLENWLKISEYDGKIHCSFNQMGTATYRLSSNSPNLQNVPFALKEVNLNLKSLFLPDSDDYEVYDLDISNAEMRVLTAYSKDQALTDAFNHGKDLHCLTAAGISNYTYEDIKANKEDKTTDQYMKRQMAKKVNFGTIYCMSAQRLQQQIWSEMRIEEPLEKCEEYLAKFFETYPGVKRYIDDTKAFVERFGFTWTFTGRRRRFAIAKYNRSQASRMGRQAVNARIQTTSSDLVMYNLIDVGNWLKPRGGRILLTVHDSILFQLPKNPGSIAAELKSLITGRTAERAPWLPVEWKFDVGRGPNYGDTHGEVN